MLRINQLKIRTGHTEEELMKRLLHLLHIKKEDLLSYTIRRQSLDARKKPDMFYVYTIDVTVRKEAAVLKAVSKKKGQADIVPCTEKPFAFPASGTQILSERPVVVGSGPAGLFCAYFLAEQGYRPILIEQGAPVHERQKDVERFWEEGVLNPCSNVQFGEGGAGTFSDGKLNTLVKDTNGRIRKVLETFVSNGAPEEILYVNKPHIGTDILMDVVARMRKRMIALGAEVHFHTKMVGFITDETRTSLQGIWVNALKEPESQPVRLDTQILVLAPGHSARDTFEMLHAREVPMEAKSFAVGVRVEHPQSMVNLAQYGVESPEHLSAASYKLTSRLPDGRGVYTFCMCPGGYVVNASSEPGRLAVNGMSYHKRDGANANSAVIVTVTPEDYPGEGPLAGAAFQRMLEEKAYHAGRGKIPVQLFEDFKNNQCSEAFGSILPQMKGAYAFANVRSIFPEELGDALEDGIKDFDHRLPGYARGDALISGVESRTSSPVRILRGPDMESNIKGLYPCGEGAGYAGGITSAAMDGIKTAEAILQKYQPFDSRHE